MHCFTIHLDAASDAPLYAQIYAVIKQAVRQGALQPEERLPSKRTLAERLQVSRNTVQAAYDQLMIEGYVYSRAKSGYYVCAVDSMAHLEITTPKAEPEEAGQAFLYDFSHGGVDLSSFPFAVWRRLYNEVLGGMSPDLLVQGGPQGRYDLRGAIAEYLRQSRGARCDAGQIIIGSGTEFLVLLLVQLLGKQNLFALENPGYEKLNQAFDGNGIPRMAISVDADGMVVEKLSQSDATVVYVTPAHQFPTGTVMPIGRRIELLNWAGAASGRYIIEDDYDSEFKYRGRPIPAIQGLDTHGKVIYMGSFSKSLTPGLRISYMALPRPLMRRYLAQLSLYLCPVPVMEQKVLRLFIERGHFERHLNKMRAIYRKKRETLVKALEKHMPHATIKGANAGLHLVLEPNNGLDDSELANRAARNGVKLCGMSRYYLEAPRDKTPPALLMSYASIPAEQIEEAVEYLKEAWGGR